MSCALTYCILSQQSPASDAGGCTHSTRFQAPLRGDQVWSLHGQRNMHEVSGHGFISRQHRGVELMSGFISVITRFRNVLFMDMNLI